MNRKTVLVLLAVAAALIGVVILTLYLLQSQQDVRSRAQTEVTPAPTALPIQTQQSCPTPSIVQNVLVEFPNCNGDVCNFTEANCSWSSVAGATKYQLKISQVESGEVVKNEQVEAAVTKVVFPITQNKTYKCDVSAINSCGTSGPAGSHSLLCAADALVASPTLPPPTPTPLPKAACGFPCATTDSCQAGLTCAIGSSGSGYCAIPSLVSACTAAPAISSCCTAPTTPPTSTPIPTIPPTGAFSGTIGIATGALILVLLGGFLLIW